MIESEELQKPDENTNSSRIIIPPAKIEPIKKPITLSMDFDGVIHSYSQGWLDGSVYDKPVPGSLEFISEIMWKHQISVFVLSTRNSYQIKEWFDNVVFKDTERLFQTTVIPENIERWEEKCNLGITNKKLQASIYLDDRALTFDGDFDNLIPKLYAFQTWMNIK